MFPVIELGSIAIPMFPIILIAAFYSCLLVIILSPKYDIMFYRSVVKAIPISLLFAVFGGKIIYSLTIAGQDVTSIFDYFSGFVFLGGFLGAMVGIYIYCLKNHYDYFDFTDVFASVLPLGQAIGRIGCFCNGCCYGKQWDGIGSVSYPINGHIQRIVPTWFIESIGCLLLFLVLFLMKKKKHKGFYTSIYIIVYSVFRFILEFFRGDEIRGKVFFLSTSQVLSVIAFLLGIIILTQSRKKGRSLIIVEREQL